MDISRQINFPFATVSFATIHMDGRQVSSIEGKGSILPTYDTQFEIKECKDLVYHADLETAKAHQKFLQTK